MENIFELRDINQTYGDKVIIDGLDLSIEDKPNRGELNVIMGESGCGKSTVLRYMAGLQKPTSGEIIYKGKPKSKSDRFAMVFQRYSSFPWYTVEKNIALAMQLHQYGHGDFMQDVKNWLFNSDPLYTSQQIKDRVKELIHAVGLEGQEKKYAQYPILSGGQLQRVAIARSLASNSEFLILDEPFGALDPPTRNQMTELLLDIYHKYSPTIIMVTHDVTEAVYLGEHIYIMQANPGKVAKIMNNSISMSDREPKIKRSQEFIRHTAEIEDFMQMLYDRRQQKNHKS